LKRKISMDWDKTMNLILRTTCVSASSLKPKKSASSILWNKLTSGIPTTQRVKRQVKMSTIQL